MTPAQEWRCIKAAFVAEDAVKLLDFSRRCHDPRRRRFALLLVKYDFLPGCVFLDMAADALMNRTEFEKALDFLHKKS